MNFKNHCQLSVHKTICLVKKDALLLFCSSGVTKIQTYLLENSSMSAAVKESDVCVKKQC